MLLDEKLPAPPRPEAREYCPAADAVLDTDSSSAGALFVEKFPAPPRPVAFVVEALGVAILLAMSCSCVAADDAAPDGWDAKLPAPPLPTLKVLLDMTLAGDMSLTCG